jgi:hypothetical protein
MNMKKSVKEEFRFEGRKAIHMPTNMPIRLPYPEEGGLPRTVRHTRREMGDYNETFVVAMGAQLLMDRGF